MEASSRSDGAAPEVWAVYACRSCSGLVTARGEKVAKVVSGTTRNGLAVSAYYPTSPSVDEAVVPSAARYLKQAIETKHAPDACVLMCAGAIDAMLKHNGLENGSLKERIDKALEQRLIPTALSDWAHRVRLDANDTRHADQNASPMTSLDAERAIDFTMAMANYLFVFPSKMPPATTEARED